MEVAEPLGIFGQLPPELRDMIYNLLIVDSDTAVRHKSGIKASKRSKQTSQTTTFAGISYLTLSCEQICTEMTARSMKKSTTAHLYMTLNVLDSKKTTYSDVAALPSATRMVYLSIEVAPTAYSYKLLEKRLNIDTSDLLPQCSMDRLGFIDNLPALRHLAVSVDINPDLFFEAQHIFAEQFETITSLEDFTVAIPPNELGYTKPVEGVGWNSMGEEDLSMLLAAEGEKMELPGSKLFREMHAGAVLDRMSPSTWDRAAGSGLRDLLYPY